MLALINDVNYDNNASSVVTGKNGMNYQNVYVPSYSVAHGIPDTGLKGRFINKLFSHDMTKI